MDVPTASTSTDQTLADQSSILALGVDLGHVRGCMLENVGGTYRLAAWLSTPRREDAGLNHLAGELLRQMGQRLHRTLWHSHDRMPLTTSDDVVRVPPVGQVVVTASPRSHVRVWLAGLTATQSIAAALDALAGSPAQVVGHTAYMADLQVGSLADDLVSGTPDLIVIVGGYDNPDVQNQQPLLDLSRLFGQALARYAPAQRPGVVFAGNRWAATRATEALQAAGGGLMETVDNVQPAPGVLQRAPLAQAVAYAYWRLCRHTAGFKEISRWVTSPGHIASLETSFIQLVHVWMELHALPALHGLYCGPTWWLHVWAIRNQQAVNLRYVEPRTRPDILAAWPPLQLVSGEWPTALWPQPPLYWCDRSGMAPMVATIGQVAPQAMIDVLRTDMFETRQT
jgi:hypothetical protein